MNHDRFVNPVLLMFTSPNSKVGIKVFGLGLHVHVCQE